MLAEEFDRWHYVRINIDSVHYAIDGEPPSNLFSELVNCCETILTEVLSGNMEPAATDAFLPFVRGATLYKHQGFREEREVRVVAMPGSQELQDRGKRRSGERTLGLVRMSVSSTTKVASGAIFRCSKNSPQSYLSSVSSSVHPGTRKKTSN